MRVRVRVRAMVRVRVRVRVRVLMVVVMVVLMVRVRVVVVVRVRVRLELLGAHLPCARAPRLMSSLAIRWWAPDPVERARWSGVAPSLSAVFTVNQGRTACCGPLQ